ncbi:hypothetical protein EOM09_04775 [bacterium]|nr:hypothetical protein [bacterium]
MYIIHIKSFLEEKRMDKSKVLQSFIELQEEKIELLKKSILQANRDIANSKDRNDSHDDPIKSQYNDFIRGMRKNLFEHQELLVKLKSIQLTGRESVSFGSLVNIENIETKEKQLYFIICAGGDSVDVDEERISAISLGAPFTKSLINKKKNEEIHFMDQRYRILAVQ